MFEQSLVESGNRARTKKPMTIFLSFAIQAVVLFVLVIIPLIYYEVLPATAMSAFLTAPPPPPPPPPPPQVVKVVKQIPSQMQNNQLMAPKVIPKKVVMIKESAPPPPPVAGVVGSVDTGSSGPGLPGGVIGGVGMAPPPPPPAAPQKIVVGGDVQSGKCLYCPQPQYPAIALAAHVTGSVILQATISKDGRVAQLQLLSGNPMLAGPTMQTVREWRYRPTLLNGVPVEVATEITVNFVPSE